MKEETRTILSISDILQRSRPLTGTSSLNPTSPNFPSHHTPLKLNPPKPTYPHQTPKTLKPLNHPTILIGTITLPTYNNTLLTSTHTCLLFSDNSATLCCDFLHFDLQILGKKIQILSWNFIPLKCGGAHLEIINWVVLESSNFNTFSLLTGYPIDGVGKDSLNARYYIHGVIESISPVSVVPCKMGVESSSGSNNVCGFLTQVLVCECKSCSGSDCNRCFTKSVTVYFWGSAVSWHPVILRMVGSVVSLSGLKKKLVFIGKEESQLMYVTTDKALLHLDRSSNQQELSSQRIKITGKGECGVYSGIVTGIYMQGMVVELDRDVLLILTEQQLILPHSLRVGAIVSVKNVHFVDPKFSWTKVLVLGACFKTSITVKSFSPMETGCFVHSQSQSLLGKFINSLAFSARLWVLLTVSSFRKKFAGMLSEKEILGSKYKEGLAQKYCSSCLPLSVFRFRHGVFTEYCKHESCGCGNEPHYGRLKLVVPVSNFITHCGAAWLKLLLEWEADSDIMGNNNQYSLLSCEGKPYGHPIRRILKSEDVDAVLLGCLKISPSSGRLQLIDATGSIDIVIPDLASIWSINNIYEVHDFVVIMDGIPEQSESSGSHFNGPLSCRSIFNTAQSVGERQLIIYLYFHMKDGKSANRPFSPGNGKENFEELESGRFHLLRVTHKFPVFQKFQGDQVVSNRSSICAEAIILPWDLFLANKDGDTYPARVSFDHLGGLMENDSRIYQESVVAYKRCKIDQSSSEILHCDLSCPLEIPCLVAARIVNGHCLDSSSTLLHCTNTNVKGSSGCKPGASKVFLEFESDSFCKYEVLRIGCYYIIKHREEDSFCTIKDSSDDSGSKVVITAKTHLWSISFSSDKFLPEIDQSRILPFQDPSLSNKEILFEDSRQIESLLLRFTGACPQLRSDVCLFISESVLSFLEVNLNVLEGGFIKPFVSWEEVASISESSGACDSDFFLPEGNLISLKGRVVAVHDSGHSSLASHSSHDISGDVCQSKFFQGEAIRVCIHVLVDHHIVRICGNRSKHAFPIGFGLGVNATFHRILAGGRKELMLTPTSFIVNNSIMLVNDQHRDESDNQSDASGSHSVTSSETVPASLISEIAQCLEGKPTRFHCRVVAVYVLVLEKNRKVFHSRPRMCSRAPLVNIPLAGFVLDDGSSTCCCWANSDTAAILLRLHETPGINFRRSMMVGMNEAFGITIGYVDKILKRHGRVVVKNYGSMFDSSCQDLTLSVDSENVINSSDEEFLKFAILNACYSTFWTVVGTVMDLNAVGKLEKRLMKLDMTMHPLPNIWVTQVSRSNPVTEARNIMQELLKL